MAIRAARAAETAAITELVNTAYRGAEFFLVNDRTDAAEIAGMAASGRFYVVAGAGGLAGAVYVRTGEGHGYFGALSVRPALRGAGLGTQLVAHAEAVAAGAGCRVMELKVADLRTDLIPWYGRLGYAECGREPFPAQIATTAPVQFVLMSKALGPVGRAEGGAL